MKKKNVNFLSKVSAGSKISRESDVVTYTVHPDINNTQNDSLVMFHGQLMNKSIMESLNVPHEPDTRARRIYRSSKYDLFEAYPNIEIYGNPPFGMD